MPRKIIPLVVGFSLLLVGLGAWLLTPKLNAAIRRLQPPALQPLPDFMVVHPKPGQAISLSAPPGHLVLAPDLTTDTTFNIPVFWHPGLVCVVLNAAALLEPGDFWTTEDIVRLASLSLDGDDALFSNQVTDGAVARELYVDGDLAAATGGPYGLCWNGPVQEGRHLASFRFLEHSYEWWFTIEE